MGADEGAFLTEMGEDTGDDHPGRGSAIAPIPFESVDLAFPGTEPARGQEGQQPVDPPIKLPVCFGLEIGRRRAFHLNTSLSKHASLGYYYIPIKM
jgi:hypothetical protein